MKPLLPLSVYPVQTPVFSKAQNLRDFVIACVPAGLVQEKMIVVVTSKIVSLAESRVVERSRTDKKSLVRQEADVYLGEIGYGCFLTVKCGLLLPSAGIDESNSATGDYILFPEDPFRSAASLWRELRLAWKLKDLGLLISDSHTTPLRRGVTGICLSYAGLRGVRNLVGQKDLFGRELRMTQMNLVDGLAASAVLMMGEGNESRPLAIITNADVEFSTDVRPGEIRIPLHEDLYYPLLQKCIEDSEK